MALHVVRLACDVPDIPGRSLSQWDCTGLARQLHHEKIVDRTATLIRQVLAKAEAALPPTPSLPEAACSVRDLRRAVLGQWERGRWTR
ncbi:MAG: hypothetical protein U0531_13610 [Dehalococcoidia bacterium]